MIYSSPLRYPGGKSALADLIGRIRRLNQLSGMAIAEPFAGGAGASLSLLYGEEASEIFINDADPAIHDFWWAVSERTQEFVKLVLRTPITIKEWKRQRDIYRGIRRCERLGRGFATFFLNRCNRSGIIMGGGPIGGIRQDSHWRLDARFNREELSSRCERIAEYQERIFLSGMDGIEFIERNCNDSIFFFIDPPYFAKGQMLYMNGLDDEYHARLALHLKSVQHAAWMVTYDDCPEIRKLYRGWAKIHPFSLKYSASERRGGRELLIVPDWIRLPREQSSAVVDW